MRSANSIVLGSTSSPSTTTVGSGSASGSVSGSGSGSGRYSHDERYAMASSNSSIHSMEDDSDEMWDLLGALSQAKAGNSNSMEETGADTGETGGYTGGDDLASMASLKGALLAYDPPAGVERAGSVDQVETGSGGQLEIPHFPPLSEAMLAQGQGQEGGRSRNKPRTSGEYGTYSYTVKTAYSGEKTG